VLDLTVDPLRVLRPGMIHVESLLAATVEYGVRSAECGVLEAASSSLRSPGLLPKHYAPRAKLLLWSWHDETDLRARLSSVSHRPATLHLIAHTQVPLAADLGRVCVIPHDPEAFARALYAELHRCDEEGAELIIVETVPDGAAWQGIADRLRRAAG
jgi:L-threonylcarbamoyladenylate synthase